MVAACEYAVCKKFDICAYYVCVCLRVLCASMKRLKNLFSIKMKTWPAIPPTQTLLRIKTDGLLLPRAAVITLQVHCLLMLISFVIVAQMPLPSRSLRKTCSCLLKHSLCVIHPFKCFQPRKVAHVIIPATQEAEARKSLTLGICN